MSQHRVLVTGATGHQGGAVVDHLLSGDYGEFEVHALTRDSDSKRAQMLAERGVRIVEGNLLDKDTLAPAVETVEAVYCVTTLSDGVNAEIKQGTNIAEVAAENNVSQFVFSSAKGAERTTGVPFWDSKHTIEQQIRDLELPATIIRPVAFMQNFESQREMILNGTLALPLTEGIPLQMVDTGDIGTLAATALQNPDVYVDEIIDLVGDEHTLESAADVFSTVTGTEVEAYHLPIEAAREKMGEGIALMYEWINNHGFELDAETTRRDIDIDLTRLETYLREQGWEHD